MKSYDYYKITELIDLPTEIQHYVLNCVREGVNKGIIKNLDRFRTLKYCIYTSQILAISSNFKIKVVEGITINEKGKKFIHSWNEYKGYHFNLIKGYNNKILHYGRITESKKFLKHLKKHSTENETIYTTIFPLLYPPECN